MTTYIARVQLRSLGSTDEYSRLDQEMERAGWTKQIKAAKGKLYILPDATYQKTTKDTDSTLLCREVGKIATAVQPDTQPQVLIVSCASASWQLSEVF